MAYTLKARTMLKAFSKRLAAARVMAGFETARDFADRLECGDAAYRKYERGEAIPPIDVFYRIVTITKTSADFLLFGTRD